MLNDLAKLIAINSIYDEPSENAPFGKGCREVLDEFLRIAENYGLKTGCDDGYAAWAEYGDDGPLIGILGHLDIVPVGEGWASDPLKLTVENGKLYGRGVSDDKGPVVACLHALKDLKEERARLGCRVRLIVGCNEETGSECVKHYAAHCEVPVVAFTPDSDFPVVASEKGIAHIKLTLPLSPETLESVSSVGGGSRANIVPSSAQATVRANGPLMRQISERSARDLLKRESVAEQLATDGCDQGDYAFQRTADGLVISAKGIAAHGSTPEKGDNAVRKILSLLAALTNDDSIKSANEYLASPRAVQRLGIDCRDETGALTLNLGVCRLHEGSLELTLDLRLPQSCELADIMRTLDQKFNAKTEILHVSSALAFPESDALIQTLMGVYREVTGDYDSRPLHIGGGTYAKELPNCVAFGAVFPNEETHMHEPDECYPVEHFYKIKEIYYRAVKALCRIYSKT